MAYRNKLTNEYPVSEREIKRRNPDRVWGKKFIAPDGYEWVFPAPKPASPSVIQRVQEIDPVFTDKGVWEQAWEIVDAFSDYEDEEGNIVTKAEQEAEAIAAEQARQTQAMIDSCTSAINELIQDEVDKYNKANGLAFDGIHNVANYAQVTTYTHYAWCNAVWLWSVDVWEAARAKMAEALAGTLTITSADDLIPLLPTFNDEV